MKTINNVPILNKCPALNFDGAEKRFDDNLQVVRNNGVKIDQFKPTFKPTLKSIFSTEGLLGINSTEGLLWIIELGKSLDLPLDITNEQDRILMFVAASEGKIEVMQLLQSRGVPVAMRVDISRIERVYEKIGVVLKRTEEDFYTDGATLMHGAAKGGKTKVMKWLLNQGIELDAEDNNGLLPMHYVFKYGDLDSYLKVDKFLRENGKPFIKDKNGATFIHLLASNKKLEMRKMLATMPWYYKWLLPFNAVDNYGGTPLHYAAKEENLAAIQYLLEIGANPYLKDLENKTALSIAEINNKKEIVNLLKKWMKKHPETEYLSYSKHIYLSAEPLITATTVSIGLLMVASKSYILHPTYQVVRSIYRIAYAYLTGSSPRLMAFEEEISDYKTQTQKLLNDLSNQQEAANQRFATFETQINLFEKKITQSLEQLEAGQEKDRAMLLLIGTKILTYGEYFEELMEKRRLQKKITSSPKHDKYYRAYMEVWNSIYIAAMVIKSDYVDVSPQWIATKVGKGAAKVSGIGMELIPLSKTISTLVQIGFEFTNFFLEHFDDIEQRKKLANISNVFSNPIEWFDIIERAAAEITVRKWERIDALENIPSQEGVLGRLSDIAKGCADFFSTRPYQTMYQYYAERDSMAGLQDLMAGKLNRPNDLARLLIGSAIKLEEARIKSESIHTKQISGGVSALSLSSKTEDNLGWKHDNAVEKAYQIKIELLQARVAKLEEQGNPEKNNYTRPDIKNKQSFTASIANANTNISKHNIQRTNSEINSLEILSMEQVTHLFQKFVKKQLDPKNKSDIGRKYGGVVCYSEETGALNQALKDDLSHYIAGREPLPKGSLNPAFDMSIGKERVIILLKVKMKDLGVKDKEHPDFDSTNITHYTTLGLEKCHQGIQVRYADSLKAGHNLIIPQTIMKALKAKNISAASQIDFPSKKQTGSDCGYYAVFHALQMLGILPLEKDINEFIDEARNILFDPKQGNSVNSIVEKFNNQTWQNARS